MRVGELCGTTGGCIGLDGGLSEKQGPMSALAEVISTCAQTPLVQDNWASKY